MIKFFRKIRLKLISEKRLSKYLIYATGEIVLVVLGILIALQLNIKNEERKNNIRNNKLLIMLKHEAQSNINRADTLLNVMPYFFEHAGMVRKILNRGVKKTDLDTMRSEDIWYYNAFNLNKTTFEQIKNTGALYDIGTDSLIEKIELYYQLCERESQYNEVYAKDVVAARERCAHGWIYLEHKMRYGAKDPEKVYSWLFDPESEQNVNLKLFTNRAQYHSFFMSRSLREIRTESQKLIVSIEEELSGI